MFHSIWVFFSISKTKFDDYEVRLRHLSSDFQAVLMASEITGHTKSNNMCVCVLV